ncbi:hypothetical protein M5U04_02435 [Xenorhabdus sp. XENO-1]|uniref:hypothetical protein n=1 Tax=Xenorhabdus bovienii TaxID=40576 RepID=UPI0020CA8AE8|nr:hypothetical protein [Xenorhabdus bovienii]MCP9266986.1 hypothetical protein [Xenorhabdus bovienii subsp. africana]
MKRNAPDGLFENTKPGNMPNSLDKPQSAPQLEILASSQAVHIYVQESKQYVNINGSGWAILEDYPRTTYFLVQYYKGNYIVIADGSYKGRYLSYNDKYYVGGFVWSNATYWVFDPINSTYYPGLYPYPNGGAKYLCVNGLVDAMDSVVTVVSINV